MLLGELKESPEQKQAISDAISVHFSQVYGFGVEDARKPDRGLFVRLYDLPWQCAFLRGLDFVHPDSKLRAKKGSDLLWQVHRQTALGRELYQLALDFYVHDVDSASNRLADAVRAVDQFLSTHNGALTGEETLTPWLRKSRKVLSASLQAHTAPQRSESDRKSGVELEALLERLHNVMGKEQWSELAPLKSFLEVRSKNESLKSGSGSFRGPLIEAFSQSSRPPNHEPINAYMLTRICTAGHYRVHPDRALAFDYIKESTPDYTWSVTWPVNPQADLPSPETLEESYYVLLGRYDVLSIVETRPMSRSRIPRFYKRTKHTEPGQSEEDPGFPSFFARREMAIPVRLNDGDWEATASKPILAIISIALIRPAARLDFLKRLLEVSWHEATTVDKDEDPKNLNELKGYFEEGDRAYLSDGWGDMLLVLTVARRRYLHDVFKIQEILFEDFQVERTELIFTPQCVSMMTDDRYRLSLQVRLLGDRALARDNEEFLQAFDRQKGTLPVDTITGIPGLMDFNIGIQRAGAEEHAGGLYESVIDAINQERVDRFQTIIGIIPDKKTGRVRVGGESP